MESRNVYAVLAEVQHRLTCPKGQYNKFGGFAYRSLEDINAALKPICTDLGCGYMFSDEVVQVDERYYLRATATFWADGAEDTVSVSAMAREQEDKKGMDDAQITGLASSYARKYAACGLFSIDSGEEVDAMDNQRASGGRSPKGRGNSAPKAAKPQKTAPQPRESVQASDEQLTEFAELMGEFAELRGKDAGEVLAAVRSTKALKALGVTPATRQLDAEQAAAAIKILNGWIEKAQVD